MFLINFCQHGSNFGRKFQPILEDLSGESDENTPVPSFRSLKTKGYKAMGIAWASEIYTWVIIVLWFHVLFIMTVYYKMQLMLLKNVTAILLQNETEVYYKTRQVFYYKMRHLLQNATFITSCNSTYSSFIFFNVIFICVTYLFSLTMCLMSSSSILLSAKFWTSCGYLSTILYFSIT